MKYTLKISLAAALLGLSITSLLRADDQSVPVQPLPATPAPAPATAPATTPGEGEKPSHQRTMNPQQMLQRLSDRLNLTDDQKAKILPLIQAQADKLNALHNDESVSDDDKREKMRAIMKSSHEKISALLTPDQQEKFKGMRGGRDREGHDGPPPADNPAPPST